MWNLSKWDHCESGLPSIDDKQSEVIITFLGANNDIFSSGWDVRNYRKTTANRTFVESWRIAASQLKSKLPPETKETMKMTSEMLKVVDLFPQKRTCSKCISVRNLCNTEIGWLVTSPAIQNKHSISQICETLWTGRSCVCELCSSQG